MLWPFDDDAWDYDPDAVLDDSGEEGLLQTSEGLPLLVAAAGRPGYPKRDHLPESYTRHVVGHDRADTYPALRAAAGIAAASPDERTRGYAAWVDRLLGYRARPARVPRARAEQMAADLLRGPLLDARLPRLEVRITPDGRQWLSCDHSWARDELRIDRRTGVFTITTRPR
ncbi:hypothetical protein [Spirilliplanes yamanashiensis]|uniref:Uncharacterized protein n=1 Tax=Spirilliplanes yamanashiensis TaxID=42233 RepID=A0A8J4DKK9_9ACTN|nr:hypothetical protein [Spirilliplanes yamanashiensis]MDP9817569.1 hypothetical protein [Spirilliplanes yamanashiensis]GIJ04379.1 hypothetical protein Sya03_37310 [Spirilliplanes yamanashiensis]